MPKDPLSSGRLWEVTQTFQQGWVWGDHHAIVGACHNIPGELNLTTGLHLASGHGQTMFTCTDENLLDPAYQLLVHVTLDQHIIN